MNLRLVGRSLIRSSIQKETIRLIGNKLNICNLIQRKPKMNFISSKKYKEQIRGKQTERTFLFDYISQPPTLQNIAAVSIAIKLWTEPDIREDVRQYSENSGFDYTNSGLEAYDRFAERVLQKLNDTFLPNSMKCQVSDIIQPIGFQLLKCFSIEEYGKSFRCYIDRITDRYLYEDTSQSEDQEKEYCRFYDIYKMGGSVYWTMDGIIDNVTSLKEIITNADQEKDFYCLYELACKYCLEEYIPDLWRKISHDKKNELDFITEKYKYHLIAYWTAFNENKMLNLLDKLKQNDVRNLYENNLSIHQNMISLSIFIGNPYSLKYFWYQLNEQEREANLRNWVKQAANNYTLWGSHEYKNCNDKTSILCFLLSQYKDEQQQKEVFQAHAKIILRTLFFHWPWQKFFMPTISKMLDYISEQAYVSIMSLIADKNEKISSTKELFREIWLKSPIKLKKSLIQTLDDSTGTLFRFLDVDDVETIYMIFESATTEEKKRIIFDIAKSYSLFTIIYSNKLHLIDNLVTKSLTSSCDIDHFKHCVILEHTNHLCKKWISDNNFHAVDMFLKWGIKSPHDIMALKEKLIDKNKIYSSLVCLGDYELIDRFMHWCFESEDEISEFKIKFIHEVDEDNSSICSHLLWELSCHQQGWDLFEKFVSYSFCSVEKVSEFKGMYLESVTSFLESYNFEFADKFVIWCLGSVDESNRFKNSFALSEKGRRFILRSVNKGYPIFYHISELIKWLSISKESAAELKCKLNKTEFFSEYCHETVADYKRRALLYLLDKHVDTEFKGDSNSRDDDSDITTEIMKALRVSSQGSKFPET